MPSMTDRKCVGCGDPFKARTADVRRGWGRFCSKSCKASEQERRTGQYRAFLSGGDSDGHGRGVSPSFESGPMGHGQE